MPDILILGDTTRSPELRREVPVMVPDPFLYVERDGERHVVGSSLEAARIEAVGSITFHPFEDFGLDELRRSGMPRVEIVNEVVVRAVRALGVSTAIVPATFPLLTADRLRAAGVAIDPDQASFDTRRRVKTAAQLEGIRRAQAAAEAGMAAARDVLRGAVTSAEGDLSVGGAPLRCEDVKAAIARTLVDRGATTDELVVSHGWQTAIAHHLGDGVIRAGEPIVIDLWPRDLVSACHADMTRTFVVGEVPAEIAQWHRLCREVLDQGIAGTRVGVTGRALHDAACDVFERAGHPTQRTKADGEMLEEGFFHSLGHGVGLSVHEEPLVGLLGGDPLVAGDVITIEPGLYRSGLGGVRLEDVVHVTAEGAENLTRFPYGLAPS